MTQVDLEIRKFCLELAAKTYPNSLIQGILRAASDCEHYLLTGECVRNSNKSYNTTPDEPERK